MTAERSPPDSRITGADSPVMADSSTEAMPSSISPSPGINSPARDHDHVAGAELEAGTVSSVPSSRSRRATRSARVLPQGVRLRLAAALGHGLGEVREEDREPQPERDRACRRRSGRRSRCR